MYVYLLNIWLILGFFAGEYLLEITARVLSRKGTHMLAVIGWEKNSIEVYCVVVGSEV